MATSAMRSKVSGAAQTLKSNPSFQAGVTIGNAKADEIADEYSEANIMDVVRLIGGAMIGIAVLVVILNQIFQLDSIANSSGPFSGITEQLTTIGVSAITLLVVGLLVVAANRIMGFFGRGGM